MIIRTLKYSLLTLILFSLAIPAHAGIQARVQGQVLDANGNPIPGAVVTITSEDVANYKKIVETDKKGTFSALIIDATRRYNFDVAADGYQSEQRPFKVQAGSTNNFFKFELVTAAEARAANEESVGEQPGYKEIGEAKELYLAGDKAGARGKLEEAVAILPDFVPALSMLGEINLELGDPGKALEIARTCLEEDDESLQCLAIAANACQDLGDDEGRAAFVARYETLNPDDPTVLYNKAAACLNKLDDDGARPALEQCLEVDPDYPECNFEYGMLLLRTGDMEGAKRHLEKYLEVAPDGRDAATAVETIKYL
jgi:tetratricopeptide (TPR) repeat protein